MKPVLVALVLALLAITATAQALIQADPPPVEGQATLLGMWQWVPFEGPPTRVLARPTDVVTWSFGDGSPDAIITGSAEVWHVFPRGGFNVTAKFAQSPNPPATGFIYAAANPPIIVDVDAPVQVFENAGSFTLFFSRSGDVHGTTTVNYRFIAPIGAESKSGTVVFAPGELDKQVAIALLDDAVFWGNRVGHLLVSVNDGSIVRYGARRSYDAEVLVNILEDETPPSLTVDDDTVREDAGEAVFTVRLSKPAARNVLLFAADVTARDGLSAKEGTDYKPFGRELVIPAGATSAQVHVRIVNDNRPEPSKTFALEIQNFDTFGMPLMMTRPRAVGTIIDDDHPSPRPRPAH